MITSPTKGSFLTKSRQKKTAQKSFSVAKFQQQLDEHKVPELKITTPGFVLAVILLVSVLPWVWYTSMTYDLALIGGLYLLHYLMA
jgi:hypothetical protein